MKHTMVSWNGAGPELAWEPVRVTKWEPQERKY